MTKQPILTNVCVGLLFPLLLPFLFGKQRKWDIQHPESGLKFLVNATARTVTKAVNKRQQRLVHVLHRQKNKK